MNSRHNLGRFLLAGLGILAALTAAACHRMAAPLAEADLDAEGKRIVAAMPAKPSVRPDKARKVLVFSRTEGFRHGSTPVANKAFEIMGKKTGAFEAVVSEDMKMFDPESLRQFDAVLFNNTTRLSFEDPRHRQALMDFVKGGKGVIGVHAATDNFYNWREAAEMMGGLFDGHPWGGGGTWAVKIDEPKHPLNEAFGGKGFLIKDEIYQITGPYGRDTHRVLLSLDMTNPRNPDGKRTDGDNAISWIRTFGKGRVFYCSLGHNNEIFWDEAVLRHFLDGIQFAIGDLKADATPSAQLKKKAQPALTTDRGGVEDPCEIAMRYDFDQSRAYLSVIESRIRSGIGPKESRIIEDAMIDILESPESSFAAKQFACRTLRNVGTKRSVPALTKMLGYKKIAHMARYALEFRPYSEVDRALRRALGDLDGELRIGVISTISNRGDRKAVGRLAKLAAGRDETEARAAIAALGRIGGAKAAETLARLAVPESLEALRMDSYLLCADKFLAEGRMQEARAIYREMSRVGRPTPTRIAALRGIVRVDKENSIAALEAALKDPDRDLGEAAGKFAADVPGEQATKILAQRLPSFPPDACVAVLASLAARGDRAATPAVVKATQSRNPSVRLAAIRALAALGDASTAPLLARLAASEDEEVGKTAATSLNELSANGVDAAILERMASADGPTRAALVRAMVARRSPGAVDMLVKSAKDPEPAVREESLKGLGDLAEPKHVPTLVRLLVETQTEADLKAAEKALLEASRRVNDEEQRIDNLLAPIADAPAAARASLISLLGKFGGEKAVEPATAALKDQDAGVRDAAIHALADWPDSAPMATLLDLSKSAETEIQRILALRGYIRMVGLPSDLPVAETLANYQKAMKVATRQEEKKMALDAVSKDPAFETLAFVERYLKDAVIAKEARAAYRDVFRKAIDRSGWKATASANGGDAKNAIDGDPRTRWTTGENQAPGQWFCVDLGSEQEIAQVVVDAGRWRGDYPRGYEVYLSKDGKEWGEAVVEGEGRQARIDVDLASVRGQHVKVVQSGTADGSHWSIDDFIVVGCASGGSLQHAFEILKGLPEDKAGN
ncbi:MAG TPA: ThuA domain-containing protein [Sumerlaeia bacterium]|nr:ThuA domain-containing protein [Sumerlaeia bacterium]